MNGTFSKGEWLANICSHIPNPREHMVRYYVEFPFMLSEAGISAWLPDYRPNHFT